MKVHSKIGSPERMKEIFQKINKVKVNESFNKTFKTKLNETFDTPKKNDEKYLNKGGDQKGIDVQPNKYDDGVREPRERNIQVKDKSLEKLKGDDKPIVEAGIGSYDAYNSPEWTSAKKEAFPNKEEMLKQLQNIERQHGKDSPEAKKFQSNILNRYPEKGMGLQRSFKKDFGEGEEIETDGEMSDEPVLTRDDNGDINVNGTEEIDAEVTDIENLDTGDDEVDIEMGDNGEEALEGGLADGASPADFDPRQILLGMEVEMEHTHTPQEALEIAMDHLKEDPAYYGNEGEDPDLEAQENAAEDAAEIEDEVIGMETEVEDENPESMENDDLSVNMNWLETLKPNKVDDMEI